MMDKLKTYFVEVVLKNVTPKVTAALMSAIITFLVAHQEFMEQMGITYYPDFNGTWHGVSPTGQLLIVEFDTLGKWGAAMLVVSFSAGWAFLQHHTVATVTGAPQSGDKRVSPDNQISGGQRASDPPAA
jgi:hypothetical protein